MTASVSEPVIELHDIVKRYGRTVALDGLDLSVGRGEVFGLLGPNGAGKTTAVKLLLGLARPTSAARGRSSARRSATARPARRIGYLPELFRYQPWLRAREVLAPPRRARRPAAERRAAGRSTDALAHGRPRRTGRTTPSAASRRGCSSASGSASRCSASPELVLLDEPTSALDPVGRERRPRRSSRAARDRGATVFLNSHLLTEVERVCDRVAILHRGRVVAAGRSTRSSPATASGSG